jgi:hypothetical protein
MVQFWENKQMHYELSADLPEGIYYIQVIADDKTIRKMLYTQR